MARCFLRALGVRASARLWAFAFLLLGVSAAASATVFTDHVIESQTFNVVSSPFGGLAGCDIARGAHAYGARYIEPVVSGNHVFDVTNHTGLTGDPFLAIYRGSFDPANPLQNLIGCQDDRDESVDLYPT